VTDFVHVGIAIDRPCNEVYAFAADPANLPRWASGLTTALEREGDVWIAQSPIGRIAIRFAGPNDLGVLDHWVTLPNGSTEYNPVRAYADGERTQVVFSVHRSPGFSDEQFAADAATVRADLETLKEVLER
jgi:hypothetical protein